jgi:hypothetical protein
MPVLPVKESRARVESIRWNDSEEVIRAIEAIRGVSSYETRRNFLLQSGKIKLAAGPVAAGPGSRAVLVDSRDSRARSSARAVASAAKLMSAPKSEREIVRDKALAARVTQECKPYVEEGDRIKRRMAELESEIDRIGLQIDRFSVTLKDRRGLLDSSKKPHKNPEFIVRLQTLYVIERVQKEEERMRLQDRLKELNEIIGSIYRKHEVPKLFVRFGTATYTIPLDTSKTVQSVIDYLYEMHLVSLVNGCASITLQYSQQPLVPEKTLADYNIQAESTVYIRCNLPAQQGGRNVRKKNCGCHRGTLKKSKKSHKKSCKK